MEGIASFTPGGRFLAANRNGLFQLGLASPALQAESFSSLFGLPVSSLYDHYGARHRGCSTGDVRRAQAIARVDKVLGRGVPVLVSGETGTGKGWLAQASCHPLFSLAV